MCYTLSPMAKSKKSKKPTRTTRSKKTAPKARKQSDATRIKRLARELERAQDAQAQNERRAEEIRQQMMGMRDKCAHPRLMLDDETGNIVCRDCLKVVGIIPGEA